MSETKQLLEMLRDANPAVRRFALQRLGESGDRTTIPELRRATEDEDPGVSTQAEKALYLLLQQNTVGPGLHERLVSLTGPVEGAAADVFDVESVEQCGRQLLKPHAVRMARELLGINAPLARACAAALGKIKDAEFIPALGQALSHEDRRAESAYALSSFNVPEAAQALLVLLEGPDRQTIRLGAYALGTQLPPEAVRKLTALLIHSDPEVRTDVVFALGESGDSAVARKIALLLDDKNDQVVIRTLSALRKLEHPDLVEAVLSRIPTARNDKIRATLIGTLMGMKLNSRAVAALERAVQDPDPRVRANAVEVIGSLSLAKDEKQRLLKPAQEDRNNRVLANLAIAMGDLDTLFSLRLLSDMLNSQDKWERASAVYAAGFIHEERVALWLANIFMFEEDPDVLRNTVSSLSRFRGQNISENVTKALRHHNPSVRSGSARVLGALGDRVGREALLVAVEAEGDPSVKADMLGALAKLCDASHIGAIAAALKDTSSRVQARALEALEQIGSVEILPHVEPFLSSLDPRVKANAARALWKLGQLDVATILGGMLHSVNADELLSAVYALGELGSALECVSDLRHFYLLASALRARARESEPAAAPARDRDRSPAPRILADLLDAEQPLRLIYAGRYPEAINTLQAQLQSNPGSLPANFLVGDLYRKLENLDLALKHFEACRSLGDEFVNLELHLAGVRAGLSDTRSSVRHYLSALKTKIGIMDQVVDTAMALVDRDKVGDASLVLKALVQQVPIDSKMHLKVGAQFLTNGHYDQALDHLFKALMADPKDPRVLVHLAVLMAKLDQRMVLRKVYEWLVQLVGHDDPLARQVKSLLDTAAPEAAHAVTPDAAGSSGGRPL